MKKWAQTERKTFKYAFCAKHKTVSKYIKWELHPLGLELLEKIAKKINPAAEITQDVIDVIKAYRGNDWFDLARKVGELAFDTVKTAGGGTLKLFLNGLEATAEATRLVKKIRPLIDPLQEIYSKVDAATFGKIYTAMSKMTNKNVLDKFGLFIYPNGTKHLQFGGSTKDLFNTIRNEFGLDISYEPPPLNGIYFESSGIRLTWYPILVRLLRWACF